MNSVLATLKQTKNIVLIIGFVVSIFSVIVFSDSPDVPAEQQKNEIISNNLEVRSESVTDKVTEKQLQKGNKSRFFKIVKVIDGDTVNVEIDGKEESVRLIGIDSPETTDPRKPVQCFGNEAATKLSGMLNNKQVELVPDETQDDKDKYGRLLRYIFTEDGTNINKFMVEEGYAFEYTYNIPYKYRDEFKKAEELAREKQLGLWAEGSCNGEREIKQAETKTEQTSQSQSTTQTQVPQDTTKSTIVPPVESDSAYTCNCAKACGQMATCEEAYYQLNTCGCYKRDADGDGVPCESLCR